MEYKIDMGRWGSVFAVPCEIVDKFLNKLDETQLRVLIYMLRNSETAVNGRIMSEKLGITADEVDRVLICLKNMGLLLCANPVAYSLKEERNVEINKVKLSKEIKYYRPKASDVVRILAASKDMQDMMKDVEIIWGEPISTSFSGVLVQLHERGGLPPAVILMLIQYAVSSGIKNVRYIEMMGLTWANCGIDTIEKAEKKIADLDRRSVVWKNFERVIGIDHRSPTSTEEEAVMRWVDEWHFDDRMIREAYDRCVDMKGKYILKYMDSIIKRWKNLGIFSIEQALSENKKRLSKKPRIYSGSEATYDIEDYENYNILDYID